MLRGLGWAAEGPLGVVWMQPWSGGRRAVAMGLGKTEAKGTWWPSMEGEGGVAKDVRGS